MYVTEKEKIKSETFIDKLFLQCQDSNLRMVALALSGFSFEKSLWRSQCITALSQIIDPHLRALFAFLTPDNDSYDIVLVRHYSQLKRNAIPYPEHLFLSERVWYFTERSNGICMPIFM